MDPVAPLLPVTPTPIRQQSAPSPSLLPPSPLNPPLASVQPPPSTHIGLGVSDQEAAVLTPGRQQLVGLRPAHRAKVPVLAGQVGPLPRRVGAGAQTELRQLRAGSRLLGRSARRAVTVRLALCGDTDGRVVLFLRAPWSGRVVFFLRARWNGHGATSLVGEDRRVGLRFHVQERTLRDIGN